MSSLMPAVPSFVWNTVTQRVLSQSNNASYAARGVYRVYDTDNSRKGDYWFRDFGMVMACAYMTEVGFRAVDKWYTVPLITKALGLHQLSELKPAGQNPLYTKARNYTALPEIARARLMGTLIRNSSDLVPKLMKELELRQGEELGTIANDAKKCLSQPKAEAYATVQQYFKKHGLQDSAHSIQSISRIENQAVRSSAIQELFKDLNAKRPGLQLKTIQDAVKLEDARQIGILMDHLHRNLNFTEYLQENYLNKNSKLSGCLNDLMADHWNRLSDLHTKGKNELPELLKELRHLPPSKRVDALHKKLDSYRNLFYLKNSIPLVPQAKIDEFGLLTKDMQAALLAEGNGKLKETTAKIETFYRDLANPQNQAHSLNQFWNNLAPDLKKKISNRLENVLDDVRKLSSEQKRHEVLDRKFKALAFDQSHPEFQRHLDALLTTLKQDSHIPNDPSKGINRQRSQEALKKFIDKLPNQPEALLKPLVKALPNSSEEFKRMVIDGMKSKSVVALIGKIQKNGTWPKMVATVILNIIFYGLAASNFDNKILQPYQQKLVAKRGTSQDIVTAGYLGLIPGAAVLTQLFDKTSIPLFKKMNHFNRFTVVGGAALAAFAGGTFLILQQLAKQPVKPLDSAAPAPTVQPVFQQPVGSNLKNGPFPGTPSTFTQTNLTALPFQGSGLHSPSRFNQAWPHFNGQQELN